MAAGRGEEHTTRSFATGAFEFAVATASADDRRLVESLFRDVPAPRAAGRPTTTFSLLRKDAEGESWTVGGPNVGVLPMKTLDWALELLIGAVNRCALDAEPLHLHLHAALATHDGRAAILAAERNTGKTTTVAHLVARGWGFVTDETVRLSRETDRVTGFPKPLSIKPSGSRHVEHLEQWMIPPMHDGAVGSRFVPVGASGASVADGGAPHLVVLLRRGFIDADTGPVAQSLHPADAVVYLMQETLDAERFGTPALRLATLAASAHSYELLMGTPEATADAIERLFRLDPPKRLEVAVLPQSDAFSPGVVSLVIGDRAVVHNEASGQIFALDEGATRVWKQLGGWDADDDIDLGGQTIAPFVAQLRALGVLVDAA